MICPSCKGGNIATQVSSIAISARTAHGTIMHFAPIAESSFGGTRIPAIPHRSSRAAITPTVHSSNPRMRKKGGHLGGGRKIVALRAQMKTIE